MSSMLEKIRLHLVLLALLMIALFGCQSISSPKEDALYHELGGTTGIEQIVDIFIYEIGENEVVVHHFEDTDIDRFREKQIEHLCVLSGGPCEYTGDDMIESHLGMNITETEFNSMTNSLITALDKAGVSLGARNRLLSILAAMRGEIIYR